MQQQASLRILVLCFLVLQAHCFTPAIHLNRPWSSTSSRRPRLPGVAARESKLGGVLCAKRMAFFRGTTPGSGAYGSLPIGDDWVGVPGGAQAAKGGLSMQLKPGDGVNDAVALKASALETGVPGLGKLPGDGGGAKVGAWAAVAILLGINVHNQWTRALIYYLVSFKSEDTDASKYLYMNMDLGFDQAQYSFLASFAFTGLFTVASLFAGRAADKFDRSKILVAACALWSVSTAATGLAVTYENVAATRAIQGITQAFAAPQAYGLIASMFTGEGLATANSIFATGVYVGGALASLSILMDERLGWRNTNFIAGGIGVAIAAVAGLAIKDVRNDLREQQVKNEKEGEEGALLATASAAEGTEGGKGGKEDELRGAVDAVKTVLGNRFVQYLFVATSFRFCAGYGIGVWKAPFFREAFPDYLDQFSVANAFIISAGGILSSVLGGIISDKFSPRDQRVQLWVPAVGSLLAVPLWLGTVHSSSFYDSAGLLFFEYVVAECWFGPVVASLYRAVPVEVQGTAQGLFTVLTAAGNVMPVLIGALLSDYPLSDVLGYCVGGAYVMSSIFFFIAGENMPLEQARSAKASDA